MSTTKDAPSLHLDFVEIVAPRLWMSTSYKNTYVAATPTTKFDVDNPGTGWFDCGTIKSVRVPVAKEVFEHKQGIPKTTRKQWETDRTAQITFDTTDLTPYVEALIKGATLYNVLGSAAASAEHVASLYTDGTRRRKYVKLTKTVNPGFSEYDIVVCGSDTNASNKDCYNIGVVESLSASLVTMADAGFPVDPVAGDLVQKVRAVEFLDSLGSDTDRSALLFWDTVVSGSTSKAQYAMYFPKVRNYSGGDMDMKDSAEPYSESITLSAEAMQLTFADGSTSYAFYKKWLLQF